MRRGQLFWGVILLLVGGLMLANSMGYRLPNGTSPLEMLWPILLIVLGGWVLLGVFLGRTIGVEKASIETSGARTARVRVEHGAGELKVRGGAADPYLAVGSYSGGLDSESNIAGDRLNVRMRPRRDFLEFPFFGPASRLDWDVSFNSRIPLDLSFSLGANKADLDLRDLNVTALKLETGASESRIVLPAHGRYSSEIDLGAASLEVIVPDGVLARIRASIGIASLDVDQNRFPRQDDYYVSPGYEAGANSVDLTIDGGAASIRVR